MQKGRPYGTIRCDLERHCAIDLMPDSFAAWLKDCPDVQIISRHRGNDDIKSARQGAPQAVQVADRFHLLVEMRKALMRAVEQCDGRLRGNDSGPPD